MIVCCYLFFCWSLLFCCVATLAVVAPPAADAAPATLDGRFQGCLVIHYICYASLWELPFERTEFGASGSYDLGRLEIVGILRRNLLLPCSIQLVGTFRSASNSPWVAC